MTEITRYVKGQDPDRDAWLTNFFTENHLAYETFPDAVASPEQLKFIVHLDEGEIYALARTSALRTAERAGIRPSRSWPEVG